MTLRVSLGEMGEVGALVTGAAEVVAGEAVNTGAELAGANGAAGLALDQSDVAGRWW
jgi:hypothetical protein